ncbi:MAG: hypothetical protein RMJ18_02465, partial [Candidatus Aenigmarchaeota archaeon]|nr:hypothetical protein [Candidatus Aenigmarchaeota archaeon]MDW8160255.1 hypothetical protein [Candidatus Aenigmarchaeota archaeon]
NGYQIGGFFVSTSNSIGFLHHPAADRCKNDESWIQVGLTAPLNTNLLTRIVVKNSTHVDLIVTNYDTGVVYHNVLNIANSVSSEPITLGRRYDNGYTGQGYEAYWDWIFVRKFSSPEPTTTVGSEETPPPTQSPVFFIQPGSGNVGIGTSNPTARLHVVGSFIATGTKSATVNTSYGPVKLYALESPEVRFIDEGTAKLVNGVAVVHLDKIFTETIEGKLLVHITPLGPANLYVAETGNDYFVVKCFDKCQDVEFNWLVSATRKGYKGVRLERAN